MLNGNKYIICPNLKSAETYMRENGIPDVAIETEYGETCIVGSRYTAAHHGELSENLAPCQDPHIPEVHDATVMLSHVDLDSILGVMATAGIRPKDQNLLDAVAYVDVYGPQRVADLGENEQKFFNAFYAWQLSDRKDHPSERLTDAKDITVDVERSVSAVNAITEAYEQLVSQHPLTQEQEKLIQDGIDWHDNIAKAAEEKLIYEDENVRAFVTDGTPCSAAYESMTTGKVVPCTFVLNQKFGSITLALYDGGIDQGGKYSAEKIMQSIFGPEAGGRSGIAGSPRGHAMTMEDFSSALVRVCDIMDGRSTDERSDTLDGFDKDTTGHIPVSGKDLIKDNAGQEER